MTWLLPAIDSLPDSPLTVADHDCSADHLVSALRGYLGYLRAEGVRPGDRIAVTAEYHLDTAVRLVGNLVYGAVSIPLNPRLGTREREHILRDASPRLVLATERPDGERPRWAEALPRRAVDDSPALILYTSGTTGAPKGAVLTAGNLAANLDALAEVWQWTARDRLAHALPLFHVHGLVLGLFGSLRVGGRLCWLNRCDGAQLRGAFRRPTTMLFAVPTMYHRLANEAENDPELATLLGSLRVMISGSAGLPVREHRRIEQLCGRGVYERYGLTETLINCAVPVSGSPRPGWVGPPLPGVELELRDVGDEGIGEVYVRGPSLFSGYLNRPAATTDDGWFATGDLAMRANDGAIRIVGRRATDLIKTGGYKVGAGEVEACLLEHPAVAEVAVVGLPDDDLGQRITAFVVLRPDAEPPATDALTALVAEELAPHKRPRDVRFVQELPRNAMGKVQKQQLALAR